MIGKLNSYFAILLITIAGAGATMIIVHIAYANIFTIVYGSEANYYNDSTQ